MSNFKNGTLYVGVTNNLLRRVCEHKNNLSMSFTNTYSLHLLVYYEFFETMEQAIIREKQIKAGSRIKKLKLIEKENEDWKDLFDTLV
jgi:putative endonuclease